MVDLDRVSRKEAKELIEQSDYGILILSRVQKVPVIGEVDNEDRKLEVITKEVEFGDEDIGKEDGELNT